MEGDVALIVDRPTSSANPNLSSEALKKEQEKWDAWKANEGLSRTEAKRRYIEKLIHTMHEYASGTEEARQLVEELEFVWEQVKGNSQHGSSEHSSPMQNIERSGYMRSSGIGGVSSSAAALVRVGRGGQREDHMRVLSPMSQSQEDEAEAMGEEREEFVDAPVSQIDVEEMPTQGDGTAEGSYAVIPHPAGQPIAQPNSDLKWRKRVESSLIKLTTEVAALREQLESRRFQSRHGRSSFWGRIIRLAWWAIQLIMADAVILWILILYMRRKKDRRLEGALRVLLGDAAAQVQKVGRDVNGRMPTLAKIGGRKNDG